MHLKSFFFRTALLQITSILLLWGMLLIWLIFFYIPSLDKFLDRQLEVVAMGFANIAEQVEDVESRQQQFIHIFESMFITSINNGTQEELDSHPLIMIFDHDNRLIYGNPQHTQPFSLSRHQLPSSMLYAGKRWHIVDVTSAERRFRVVIGVTLEERAMMLGNPVRITAIPLAIILVAIVIAILFTAYYSFRPLRRTARAIAQRQPGDFTPIDVHNQYQELRPIIHAINNLLTRVDAANQREKRFMADAAHELRTPIATVLAQLYLLIHLQEPEERREVIGDMQRGLDRAASLARQLLDISRLESESFILQVAPIDIYDELSKCIAFYVPSSLKRGIDISLAGTKGLIIETDAHSLNTIFANLLDNAIKYGHLGGRIEIVLCDYRPLGCKITLRDDGPGVKQPYRHTLFERFFRVPGVLQGGSGLGLAIAHDLTQKIGASLTVGEGIQGKGIGFTLDLPQRCL